MTRHYHAIACDICYTAEGPLTSYSSDARPEAETQGFVRMRDPKLLNSTMDVCPACREAAEKQGLVLV